MIQFDNAGVTWCVPHYQPTTLRPMLLASSTMRLETCSPALPWPSYINFGRIRGEGGYREYLHSMTIVNMSSQNRRPRFGPWLETFEASYPRLQAMLSGCFETLVPESILVFSPSAESRAFELLWGPFGCDTVFERMINDFCYAGLACTGEELGSFLKFDVWWVEIVAFHLDENRRRRFWWDDDLGVTDV